MSDPNSPHRIADDGSIVSMEDPVDWTPNNWKRRWLEATGIPIP
jgi:hypothetical protein